jgi:hypothetical protein
MNATGTREATTSATLVKFLHDTRSPLSPAQAIAIAIDEWIARARQIRNGAAEGVRGYQWKCLFLPDASDLRVSSAGQSFYARVDGDAIMFQGRAVSPRQFVLAVAGNGRNAWREIWVRLPGEKAWKTASLLRRALQQDAATSALSPLDTMSAAAESMAGALKSALAFVEHANAQAALKMDRRFGQSRRAIDVLGEDCLFD